MLFNKLDQTQHLVTEKNIREKIAPISLPVARSEQRKTLREALIMGRRDGRLSQWKVNEILRSLREKKIISDTLRAAVAEKFAGFLDDKWGKEEKPEAGAKHSSGNNSSDFNPVSNSQIDEL